MEFYKTVIKYLKACDIEISDYFFKSRLKSHPNYPSLISFVDTLEEIDLPYTAVNVNKECIETLTYPFMAYCTENGKDDFKIIYTKDTLFRNNNEILNNWSGIALMIKNKMSINYPPHNELYNIEKNKKIKNYILILFFIALPFFSINKSSSISTYILLIECIIGIFICILIVLKSMGKELSIVDHICSTEDNKGCDKVMDSKLNKLIKNFGMGDFGLIYFSGIYFYINIVLNRLNHDGVNILIIPFLLSGIVSIYSIYYQWRIIKSWCRLCILVISTIWLQLFTYLFSYELEYNIVTLDSLILFETFIIPILLWIVLKPIILKSEELNNANISIAKWKRRPDVFLTTLKNQKKVDADIWENEIILGKPDAPIKIIVAANLFCNPCALMHKSLEELYHKNKDLVSLILRFVVSPQQENDNRTNALKFILEVYKTANLENKENLFSIWYEEMNLEFFINKFKTSKFESNWDVTIDKHYKWCLESDIRSTPTIFFNGLLIPSSYNVNDLKLVIPHFSEHITQFTFK